MSAFNRRFQGREIFGVPFVTAVGAVIALPFLLFTLLLPADLKILTGLGALCALAVAAAGIVLGDEWPFVRVMLAARRERGRVTSETWSDS